jgi:hypothetical protein
VKNHLSHVGPAGRRRTRKEIAAILREHRRSGLSLLAFAREHQLCYATLLRWRSCLSKYARSAAVCRTVDPGFIPIKIEPGSLHSDYVLSWPGGRSLRIPPSFNLQSLRGLLEILEGGQ